MMALIDYLLCVGVFRILCVNGFPDILSFCRWRQSTKLRWNCFDADFRRSRVRTRSFYQSALNWRSFSRRRHSATICHQQQQQQPSATVLRSHECHDGTHLSLLCSNSALVTLTLFQCASVDAEFIATGCDCCFQVLICFLQFFSSFHSFYKCWNLGRSNWFFYSAICCGRYEKTSTWWFRRRGTRYCR